MVITACILYILIVWCWKCICYFVLLEGTNDSAIIIVQCSAIL